MQSWNRVDFLNRYAGGTVLPRLEMDVIPALACAAHCAIVVQRPVQTVDASIEAGRLLQEAGVDIVNISDSAMARVRMGAMAVAFGIQHDLDLECLVHFTTRDRNLMALESELLGAHALGVRNILALTGQPPAPRRRPLGRGRRRW
jgi:hypothetical protein